MNDEPSIRFSENQGVPMPAPKVDAPETVGSPAMDEHAYHAAKLIAALFGLLLIVVLPIGAFMSDHGILTPTPKPT